VYHAYSPLHAYPYRYAPPIDRPVAGSRPLSIAAQGLIPNAAAVRYNVGGFDPGVSVASYARPKDLHALSIQPYDLAYPGVEEPPIYASMPWDADDEDEDEDDFEEAPVRSRGSRGSRSVRRSQGPYARPGAAPVVTYAGPPQVIVQQPAGSMAREHDGAANLMVAGFAGLVGGVIIGALLSRRS
jgi:hypothetical protein